MPRQLLKRLAPQPSASIPSTPGPGWLTLMGWRSGAVMRRLEGSGGRRPGARTSTRDRAEGRYAVACRLPATSIPWPKTTVTGQQAAPAAVRVQGRIGQREGGSSATPRLNERVD